MNVTDIDAVAAQLGEWGVDFVLIGGSVLEGRYQIGTGDVDILVTVGSFERLSQAIGDHPDRAVPMDRTGTLATTRFLVGTAWVEVEFIHGTPFSGVRSGDEFVDYVRREESETVRGVARANPAVVWYMRLTFDDQWLLYVQKIARDVRAGVPISTLKDVQRIADHLGVGRKFQDRIEHTREHLHIRR
ncbi:MAG: hypothetical protein WA761_03250 [Thermoplasmata archaeon]